MTLSSNINLYIENSRIKGKLCRWKKTFVTVFISDTPHPRAKFMISQVETAVNSWNTVLKTNSINLQFQIISHAPQADIIVHWVKVGRVYEGMCKYLSVINDEIKKISIDIGLPNEYSGKDTTDLSIYCAIMHEFGHAMGLGHGVEVDDIMYVPHKKNISIPDENDIYVLKQIYCG